MSTTLASIRRSRTLAPAWSGVLELRFATLVVLAACALAGALGLAWDEQWHRSLGRDAFLTPPHALLYASTGVAGLVCLGVVLWQTARYRRGAPVDDGVTVFGIFNAPLGIVVAGFGALTTALAAPLDNYWHELYGVDVALWAPFHLMGLLGTIIRDLGLVYLAASLVVRQPRALLPRLALLLAGAFELTTFLNLARPGQVLDPTLHVGGLELMIYPLLLALLVPASLLAIRSADGRAWSASGMAGLALGLALALGIYVPWAVRLGATLEGLSYRSPATVPHFEPLALLPAGIALVAGVLADRLGSRLSPALLGGLLGAVLWALGAGLAHLQSTNFALALANGLEIPPGVQIPPPAPLGAIVLALPVALLLGSISGAVGNGLGELLRRNPR